MKEVIPCQFGKSDADMNQLKKMFYIAIAVSIAAQFYLNFFVDGFIITFSVILLPLLLYKNQNLNPILTCIITGIASPLFRTFIIFLGIKDFKEAFSLVSPDIAFYFTYGIVFYYFYTKYKNKNLTRFALAVLISDFLSNMVEISFRTQVVGLEGNIIKGLFIIALVRSSIVVILVIVFRRYESFLAREEHEARYRRLMLLTSIFESEAYFMNKNMKNIEDIMKKTFKAYRLSTEKDVPKEFQDIILDLSKDVHEIKKDYIRVIKGLEEVFSYKFNIEKMSIKDMVNILAINTKEYLKQENLNVEFKYRIKSDVSVKNHYYLMSIFRNLINNGIEACKEGFNPIVSLIVEEDDKEVKIYVTDNGIGIKEDHIDYIFNPGFSTKFNKETGDINRGIGLTLVKDLVNEYFNGTIEVKSILGSGTTFIVTINKNNL
ncbi:sensor histidine kinase [Maledivibacter halophilus]|uniref:histidine kinase n=1 Tax=Maledivibacter halophilus TaxID=36842 RepID=A0A1T5INA6_9FIRM|nr:sensor histidine kinase [Maledivibacter halophilus]SKC40625.1 two-component system, sensor histidine kinase YcbA [Maledivibacter halophilus]